MRIQNAPILAFKFVVNCQIDKDETLASTGFPEQKCSKTLVDARV
jgi:hypothetical protein